MASLYADENVPSELIEALRRLGHDVLRAFDDGRANLGIDDPTVLARATALGRAVLTNNRKDFHKLHRKSTAHAGVVTYTHDDDVAALAIRIEREIAVASNLQSTLIRITRPNNPSALSKPPTAP